VKEDTITTPELAETTISWIKETFLQVFKNFSQESDSLQ